MANIKKLLPIVFIVFSLPIYTRDIPFERPVFGKFISGDNFRELADYVLETNNPCDIKCYRGTLVPEKVERGDIIFLESSAFDVFFNDYYPSIKNPFILISHNNDCPAPGNYRHILEDNKLIAWFAQNGDIAGHPKFIPIPIGLSNRHWSHCKDNDEIITRAQVSLSSNTLKKYLFYVNINVHTSPCVRQPVYDFFIKRSFCSWVSNRSFKDYLSDLSQSKFVLSPHGNGLDCHRTWEALLMGSFPVVKTSTLDSLYEDLPVLIVHDWDEITEEFLENKYKEMSNKDYNKRKLYFDYWKDKILSLKALIKNAVE